LFSVLRTALPSDEASHLLIFDRWLLLASALHSTLQLHHGCSTSTHSVHNCCAQLCLQRVVHSLRSGVLLDLLSAVHAEHSKRSLHSLPSVLQVLAAAAVSLDAN
jgi:hypothetical protein